MIGTRVFPAWLTRQAYWLAALVPLLLPLGWWLRELPGMSVAFAWVSLLVLYGALPLLDALLGRDLRDPEPGGHCYYTDTIIPVVACLSYAVVLLWSLYTLAQFPEAFPPLALLGWTLSLANVGGVVAINVSHELIHKRDARLRNLGGLMLACVGYACFKLEHPRWHHVHVATPNDPSSAARGSTIYGQAPRAWLQNTGRGFLLAVEAARRANRPLPWLLNEMTGWYALTALLMVAVAWAFGPLAAAVFVAHAVGAALLLEVINFVEHYGLARSRREDGRYEPPGIAHSWDSDFWLSNALLLQLPRHADHHTNPTRPYGALQRQPTAPQLPLGYSTLVMVAFLPPLWRRMMHPRLDGEIAAKGG